MSRELNEEQKKHIRNEVSRNKLLGYPNPYELAGNVLMKLMELNDHETFFDNVDNYEHDLKMKIIRKLIWLKSLVMIRDNRFAYFLPTVIIMV